MRHTKPVSCRNIRAASSRLPPRQYKGLKSEDSNRLHIFCASQTTISDYASDVNTNVTCAHRHTPPQSASRTDNYLFPKRFIASYRGPDPEGDKSGRGSEASASPARALVVIRLDLWSSKSFSFLGGSDTTRTPLTPGRRRGVGPS